VQASTSLRHSNNERCRIRLWDEGRDALHGRGIRYLGTCCHWPLALHCCTFPMRPVSVDMHLDIHHSIALSQSSEMLHEGGPRRHTYITTSSTCLSVTLSSLPVCSICRLARLARQPALNLLAGGLLNIKWIIEAVRQVHKYKSACLIQ